MYLTKYKNIPLILKTKIFAKQIVDIFNSKRKINMYKYSNSLIFFYICFHKHKHKKKCKKIY